eukprot:14864-Eustigmatos_ZCMA.PRE.1
MATIDVDCSIPEDNTLSKHAFDMAAYVTRGSSPASSSAACNAQMLLVLQHTTSTRLFAIRAY